MHGGVRELGSFWVVGETDRRGQVFEPYADHLQFVLEDAEAESGIGDTWAEASEAWRISPERHVVAVGFAASAVIRDQVVIVRSRPPGFPLAALAIRITSLEG